MGRAAIDFTVVLASIHVHSMSWEIRGMSRAGVANRCASPMPIKEFRIRASPFFCNDEQYESMLPGFLIALHGLGQKLRRHQLLGTTLMLRSVRCCATSDLGLAHAERPMMSDVKLRITTEALAAPSTPYG